MLILQFANSDRTEHTHMYNGLPHVEHDNRKGKKKQKCYRYHIELNSKPELTGTFFQ